MDQDRWRRLQVSDVSLNTTKTTFCILLEAICSYSIMLCNSRFSSPVPACPYPVLFHSKVSLIDGNVLRGVQRPITRHCAPTNTARRILNPCAQQSSRSRLSSIPRQLARKLQHFIPRAFAVHYEQPTNHQDLNALTLQPFPRYTHRFRLSTSLPRLPRPLRALHSATSPPTLQPQP